MTEEDGRETRHRKEWNLHEAGTFEWTLPDVGGDFKGRIEIYLWDWCGNRITGRKLCIVESESLHAEMGKASIFTETAPSRSVGGVDYYNTDIEFSFLCEDSYAGICEYELVAGSKISERQRFDEEAGTEITWEWRREGRVDAASNNQDQVIVEGSFIDNAGHKTSARQIYHIDITPPVIEVTFDRNEAANGRYYNTSRTATVTIQERNFREEDVVFEITNTMGGYPKISAWTTSGSGDQTLHSCEVTFEADGRYQFSVQFQDLVLCRLFPQLTELVFFAKRQRMELRFLSLFPVRTKRMVLCST